MKRKGLLIALCLLMTFMMFACGGEETAPEPEEATLPLEGHTLHIYCGAGMTEPFQQIADLFQEESGCAMQITFANAGQIQTQINTAQEGDMFVAGAAEELKPVEAVVSEQVDLVKHIPVVVVQQGNPKGINTLTDLANPDIRLVLGDAEATPIGKIANKAISEAGIMANVNIVARAATAPQIFTSLAADECDAGIVWKENVGDKGEITAEADMEKYIKTIPAASLTYCADDEARTAFLDFLATDAAKNVWTDFGYEVLN